MEYNFISINNSILKQSNILEKNKSRIIFYDILRLISSFSVVIIHISAIYYNKYNLGTYNWKISFYFNGITRFSVPIFFMISGDLFLQKDILFKIIYLKYIKNLFIHYIIWSFIYSIKGFNISKINAKNIIFIFLNGHYHLWYLLTTIGLYMIIPFLRQIIKKDNLLKHFLLLSFIFNSILPFFSFFLSFYSMNYYDLINNVVNFLNIYFIKKYIFYFMIGYYINRILSINIYKKIIIYILGLIGFFFTTNISYIIAIKQRKKLNFFAPLDINIIAYTLSIFVFFKIYFNNKNLIQFYPIRYISNSTLGIYLIHPLIIETLVKDDRYIKFNFDLLYRIPFLSIIIFILSFIISVILKLIPFIGTFAV